MCMLYIEWEVKHIALLYQKGENDKKRIVGGLIKNRLNWQEFVIALKME